VSIGFISLLLPVARESSRPAAVYDEHIASYIFSVIRRKIKDSGSDVGRVSRAAQGNVAQQTLRLLPVLGVIEE
jgi:hypothetical protein